MNRHEKDNLIIRGRNAEALINDPMFQEAWQVVRAEALNSLATVDIADANEILRLQAIVKVADGMSDHLVSVFTRGQSLEDESGPE